MSSTFIVGLKSELAKENERERERETNKDCTKFVRIYLNAHARRLSFDLISNNHHNKTIYFQ